MCNMPNYSLFIKINQKNLLLCKIFQIGRERYVTDLINVTTDIDDKNHNYKFIINIIDHIPN